MGIFNKIQDMYLKHRLNVFGRQISKLSQSSQNVLMHSLYHDAYESMVIENKNCRREEEKPLYSWCSVIFYNPYKGHVSYHIDSVVNKRVQDENDPLVYSKLADISNVDDAYCLSVVTRSFGDDVELSQALADACAMNAILSATTTYGNFDRFCVTSYSASTIEELKNKTKEICEGLLSRSMPEFVGDEFLSVAKI